MKLGYFFTMYNLDRDPYREVLDRAIEQTLAIEQAGFHSVWLGEHHFGGEGWETLPNPLMLGSHLAARTTTLRIGIAAVILPQWHPLRAAEDVAMLDQLSSGRVECGVGKGIDTRALTNLNLLNPDRRDPERNASVFLETLDAMVKAWTDDAMTFEGKYYSFPRPGLPDPTRGWYHERNPGWRSEDGEYVGMSLIPKPFQQPHPPLWNMTDSPPGFALAAERGMGALTWLRSSRALREGLEYYREMSAEQGRELVLGENCGVMRVCFVAESDEEARRLSEPAVELVYRDYLGAGGRRSRDIYAEPGETLTAEDTEMPWFDFLDARGHLIIGSPETVAAKIDGYEEELGLSLLLIWMWLPGVKRDVTMRSLELFNAEVLPRLGRVELIESLQV